MDKVVCGFHKLTIGVGENGKVIVDLSHEPIYGSISLYDASIDDLRNLGEMFLAEANRLSAK
jgi:hypothetical protein